MKKAILLPVLITLALNSFAQCDSLFFRYTGTLLYDVSLINDKIIIGVGDNGYIIKSVDGGNNWRNIPDNYGSSPLRSVQFVSDSVGYVTGDAGVMKTEDQGENWFPLLYTANPYVNGFKDLYFLNRDSGFFVGTGGHISSTVDGGRTFKDTAISPNGFTSIDFINNNTGLIAGNEIYKTTDGGRSWRKINTDNLGYNPRINKIKFITSSFAVITGYDGLYARSIDGGETWTVTFLPTGSGSVYRDFYFFDENNGIIVGDYSGGSILYTSDGGQTFASNFNYPSGNSSYYTINADPLKRRVMVAGGGGFDNLGYNGRNIISTLDQGITWIPQSRNGRLQYNYIQFLNDSTGYISADQGLMFKTTDYGESWQELARAYTSLANPVNCFYFTDSLHGFAATEEMSFTRDGGKSWIQRNLPGSPYSSGVNYMIFPDTLTGISSYQNILYHTTDGALSWQPAQQPAGSLATSFITGIASTPSGKVFTSGYDGYVLESNDKGNSWVAQNLDNAYLTGIYFLDNNIGFVGTSDSVIYKTINGGITWTRIVTISHNWLLRSFAFSDPLHGFMLGNDGPSTTSVIYQTNDGGNSWKPVIGASESIYKIAGFNNCYAAGGGGLILKTDHLVKPSIPGYITGPLQVCNNTSSIYTIAQSNNLNYTWLTVPSLAQYSGTTADTIKWSKGGQYTISVAAKNTCGTGLQRNIITDVIDFKPVITVTDTLLSVTKGLNYQWYLNDTLIKSGSADTDQVLVPERSGIYKAEVVNIIGCTGITDTVQYSLPLPFHLIGFSGTLLSEKTVDLQWVGANERSNLYHVIEKGIDSVHFSSFDSLPARNDYSTGDKYNFTDRNANSGLNLYRLKITGQNGTVTYSHVIIVRGSNSDAPIAYPNPAKNFINIYKGSEAITAVNIYNNQGFLALTQNFSTGQTNVSINISNLQNGLYYLKIKTIQNMYAQQVIILR